MKGLEIEVIRPKMEDANTPWMDTLIDELYDIALDSFGKWLPYEAIDSRTRDASSIIILRDKNRAVGYAVNDLLELSGVDVNYYATALLRREIQGRGIYPELNRLRYDLVGGDAIMTRTQNPVVYRGMKKLLDEKEMQIHPNGVTAPRIVHKIAKDFCSDVTSNLVVPGVYFGRSLMDDTPIPKTDEEKEVWNRINVDKGDALIIVGL